MRREGWCFGVSATENSCAHHVTWSPNKLWRSILHIYPMVFVQVMRTHGFHPTEEELTDMIRNVDTNANGAIDFNEFIDMMVKRDSRIEDDVAHAFKV
jgi:hypothetical protein